MVSYYSRTETCYEAWLKFYDEHGGGTFLLVSASEKCLNLTKYLSWFDTQILVVMRISSSRNCVYEENTDRLFVWKDLIVIGENWFWYLYGSKCPAAMMFTCVRGFPCSICFAGVPLQYPLSVVVFARYEGRSAVKENHWVVVGLISHAMFLLSPFRQVVR